MKAQALARLLLNNSLRYRNKQRDYKEYNRIKLQLWRIAEERNLDELVYQYMQER